MPYTENDYPSSFKNFESPLKKKAIDITNRLLKEGYNEEDAIPIAISQAKDWYEDASKREVEAMEQKSGQDFQKESKDSSTDPTLLDNAVHVLPDEDKWVVKTAGAKQASDRFDNKDEAIDRAKTIAKNKATQLVIHRSDGTTQTTHNY